MAEPPTDASAGEHASEIGLYREELAVQNDELRRTNAALAATQARLAVLFDAAPVGHVALDASGRVVEANLTSAALLQRSRDALVGAAFDALLVPGDRARFRAYRERLVRGEGATSCEVAIDVAPAAVVVRVAGALLPPGLVSAPEVILTLTDETERRRVEAERRAVDRKLSEVARLESLAVMAGGVAHDFNNLLTVMLVQLDVALENVPEGSPVRASLADVRGAAEQAASLSQQMLSYTGRAVLTRVPMDLAAAVRAMEPLLRAVARNAVLRFELHGALPLFLGDTLQIQQIAMNLVINAAEALGERGGTVTVGVRRREATATHAERIELSVADDGPGMDEATQRRMFDPFFSTKFTGRGLGLAVVHGNVNAHDGTVTVESKIGLGTVFRVGFPVLASPVKQANPAAVAGAFRGEGCVLVADDEAMIRRVLARVLTGLGFTVVEAESGQEALDILAGSSPPIVAVLLDVTMAKMSGEAALRELRSRGDGRPVILMIGFSQSRLDDPTLSLCNGFLAKPLTIPKVVAALRALPGLEKPSD